MAVETSTADPIIKSVCILKLGCFVLMSCKALIDLDSFKILHYLDGVAAKVYMRG